MSADRVFRTQTIDGLVTPAFIHNGPTYFFIEMPVFADGLVDCWEMLDLALFREKVRTGWVSPTAPDGAQLSVHGAATWTIADARWDVGTEVFLERVVALVRKLNPRMENLYDCHGRTTEAVGKARVSLLKSLTDRPVRFSGDGLLRTRIPGERRSVVIRDGGYHLASLRAFADGAIELGGIALPETLDRKGLRAAIESSRVMCSVPVGTRVGIYGLGSFVVAEEHSATDAKEKLREVDDLIDRANGRPDSVERCRAAYQAYLSDPTVARREELRAAYEAVPAHTRMYVGDMDSKDSSVRAILNGR